MDYIEVEQGIGVEQIGQEIPLNVRQFAADQDMAGNDHTTYAV